MPEVETSCRHTEWLNTKICDQLILAYRVNVCTPQTMLCIPVHEYRLSGLDCVLVSAFALVDSAQPSTGLELGCVIANAQSLPLRRYRSGDARCTGTGGHGERRHRRRNLPKETPCSDGQKTAIVALTAILGSGSGMRSLVVNPNLR